MDFVISLFLFSTQEDYRSITGVTFYMHVNLDQMHVFFVCFSYCFDFFFDFFKLYYQKVISLVSQLAEG